MAEAGSFSVAGDVLHLTQPAVSKRVAALETHLRCTLFDRVGKQVALTQAGRVLLPRAQTLLNEHRDVETLITNLSGDVAGTLQLVTSHHIGLHRLPGHLRRFAHAFPKVRLDIRFEDSEVGYDLLQQGKAEVAVVTMNPKGSDLLRQVPLWEDELSFVCAREHPLAAGPHQLRALADHPCVLPDLTTYTGRIVAELFAQHNLQMDVSLTSNYLETIQMLVSIGQGWSVLPRTMLAAVERPIVAISLDQAPTISRSLGYLVNPRRALSNAGRAFISTLTEDYTAT